MRGVCNPESMKVHICCNEHQLLNSQWQLSPFLAIKYVNQALLSPVEVYNMVCNHSFLCFNTFVTYCKLSLNKMENSLQGINVVSMNKLH